MFTHDDEEDENKKNPNLELSFLGNPYNNNRQPLSERDNNATGERPLIVRHFTRLMPQPQMATIVRVGFQEDEEEQFVPEQPIIRSSSKEIDDITPSTENNSLSERLAAVEEVYKGKSIPIDIPKPTNYHPDGASLRYSPLISSDTDDEEEYQSDIRKNVIKNENHNLEDSLQINIKREILANAELLISFNSIYRETHLAYICSKKFHESNRTPESLMELQMMETEMTLMRTPIFMAEKMHKLLSDTLKTLRENNLDIELHETNNNNFINRR